MKLWQKIIVTMHIAIVALIIFFVWYITSGGEVHLIPKNYTGVVTIIFDSKNGVPEKYEGRMRVYEIPDNGILKTQFSFNYKWVLDGFLQFYYVSETGERTRIPYIDDPKKFPINQTQVFSRSAASGEMNNGPEIVYIVGKYEDADSLFRLKYGMPPLGVE